MIWIYIVAAVAAALALFLLCAGTYLLFANGIVSSNRKKDKAPLSCWEEDEDAPESVFMIESCLPYRDELIEGRKWVKSHELEDFSVVSYDGLTLRAKMIRRDGMRGVVLMMHGYRSNPLHDFSLAVKEYFDMGFACMMPYQRAHGESEGKYITYGVRERHDVVSWCRLIEEKFPGVPVILDGMSMGASTVLMATGLELPGCVRGVVADCGFTSPKDIMSSVMKRRLNMAPFPFLYTTWLAAKIKAGFGLGEVSTITELKKNRLPLLIVHGEADDLVPFSMSEENYDAARDVCDATFLPFPGAGHGMSFLTDRERYTEEVKKFTDKCLSCGGAE